MNQPTREEFDDHERRIKKLEQKTEPIPVVRDGSPEDVLKKIDIIQEDTNVLKIEMAGARADILASRESQADLRDKLIEHSDDLKVIKDKQDTHSELLGQLITIGEATKEDIASIKATQEQILALLQQKP